MAYFPVFLDLSTRNCLVVGGGRVGRRKIERLAECGAASIAVVDPQPQEDLLVSLAGKERLRIFAEAFRPEHLQGMGLVFACTPDGEENSRVAEASGEAGIPCNVATAGNGDMIIPALYRQGDLSIAVSTAGASPALSRRIREKLAQVFGPEYARLAALLKALRGPVIGLQREQEENSLLFERLASEEVLQALRREDRTELFRILQKELPDSLHSGLGELVHDLI